jgi:hypothetical protein
MGKINKYIWQTADQHIYWQQDLFAACGWRKVLYLAVVTKPVAIPAPWAQDSTVSTYRINNQMR